MSRESTVIAIAHPTDAGEARRGAVDLARRLGFDESDVGRVAIVVTEAATNVLKHAGRGEVVIAARDEAIQIFALDRGPGMADVARCLADGYSTAGSAGIGLGAMKRLSDSFEIWSAPAKGTVVVASLRRKDAPAVARAPIEVGGVSVPVRGEVVCGDGWAHRVGDDRLVLAVVDGVGHGEPAARAAKDALRVFHARPDLGPKQTLEAVHAALRSTRGAAMAIADLDLRAREIRFAGIGNLAAAAITRTGSRSMVSHNGTLGYETRRFQEFTYPWPESAVLVIHTDGLQTRWALDTYGVAHGALLTAALLYRDFVRGRDDATVVVARETRARVAAGSAVA